MIELRTFANQCSFHHQDGKYFIVADERILREISKEQFGKPDYDLLENEFETYLTNKYPPFWKNPLKYLGIFKA